MAPYTKPETVLRRSEELLSVNQPMSALASISEIFSSKRFRQTPLASLEPIMLRFIDLCVLLRKTRTVKEGLHMYKNVAQNTSVSSVETVIQHFITKSKEKLVEALAKVDEIEGPLVKDQETDTIEPKASVEVDDLEATETPESLLLSTVSEEKSRDRTYRELVTPWLRSLWEAYRTALDILRNNARLENVYQQIATEAFEFCLTHTRKTEFRRLAETLRSNLTSSQKYANQAHSINLSDPEVLQRHLDTRFHQLNTSVKLELWQESFRTAEDINGLISLSKKTPKNNVMCSFYEKMIKVFGVGESHLFHAAAYNKYYAIQVNSLADQPEKLEKLASLVLLSALAVPIVNSNAPANELAKKGRENEDDSSNLSKSKSGRLASILGLTSLPTRTNLVKDTLNRGTLKRSSADLQALYQILEVDFHPLSITRKIRPILQRLSEDSETARYVEPLKDVVMTRLFQQLSQVYDSIELTRIIKLASFGNAEPDNLNQTRIKVEKFLMEACKRGELEITLDHSTGSIKFADRMFENGINQMSGNFSMSDQPPTLLGLSTDVPLVPSQSQANNHVLQPNSASLLRTHLTRLASALAVSLKHISPTLSGATDTTAPTSDHLQLAKTAAIQILHSEGPKQQEQQIRLQKQNKEREIKKMKDEADKIRAAEAEKVAIALATQAGLNVDIKNLKGVDTNTIIQMGVEQIEKDKKELASKLKTVNKRLDHTERALRREEIPLLDEDYRLQQIRDETNAKKLQTELLEGLRAKHASELEIRKKLETMLPDFLAFKESVANKRGHDYKKAEEQARVKIEKAKAERRREKIQELKAAKARAREEERSRIEREEAERVRAEEEAKLEEERRLKQIEIEEEERVFKAKAEAKAKADREQRERERAATAEMVAKQAAREEEALARREARKLADRSVSTPVTQSPGSTTPASGGVWRRTAVAAEAGSTPPLPSSNPPTQPVTVGLERTTSKTGEVRPQNLAGLAKPGGWRARSIATGTSGESSPTIGLSRPSSGIGAKRSTTTPMQSPQLNGSPGGKKDDGEWNEVVKPASYRPPQSRTNTSGGGGLNHNRTTSGRGGTGSGSGGRW
ncbi:uncharacterized protein MELLADRAFT_118000 [Melampsora larici-populina 98AG31]|uniref:Eukaryotic translation initiation factor 3 subunit A n=1 Tax=Melampsora larici-populina (strain 98AG31 / pathotype 3-4-7) TaxID=747676 RepID=F4S426_MELLP|nr:uncharacterized protein MELLADRAFT_118000 [Melampsora larici-populina 98AG31]EGG00634.1 hypothetical protein MELLADRAFT_118000 [Melampsora larici-populina 98AG31]